MVLFYAKAIKDKEIGPYFILELGDDITSQEWIEHIELLVNFWSAMFLEGKSYKGDPYGPHFTIVGLKRESFDHWVELFCTSTDEVYVPDISVHFKEKGVHFSKQFMRKLML